ncbi:MAG: PAC2 family protein [Acidimicrobiia bacterium]|nr:PAC2 family protein [Acidimicrobiia bacterium]
MHGLVWHDRPALERPLLLAAFEGWNDAADAASDALEWLRRRLDTGPLAMIDPEEHVDYQSTRPRVELVDGVVKEIRWPAYELVAARAASRDLVLLTGAEPSYRWRSFCATVLTVVREAGCELVVTLGSLLADVPHTHPVRITGAATEPDLAARTGLEGSRYEGPTGIVGVLHDACRQAGVPSVSLWSPVPHYVASPPNPPATRGLLSGLGRLADLSLDLRELDVLAHAWRASVDEVVADDPQVAAYVRRLEEQADRPPDLTGELGAGSGELPSGDALAAELERFLRDQRRDG